MKDESKRAAGPWVAASLSRKQPYQFYVCRQVGQSDWELLYLSDGSRARFHTMQEADEAAAAANSNTGVA